MGRIRPKQIALERIGRLFELAIEMQHKDPALSQRYVELARRIAMRERVRIPLPYKRMICKGCKRFVYPGLSCRVRIRPRREPHIAITCLHCGHVYRMPIAPRP